MFKSIGPDVCLRRGLLKTISVCASGALVLIALFSTTPARAETPSSTVESSQLPANWRDVKDGVGGFPAGPMLEIALRHTHSDKLEMFKWRSEFIAMLSAQTGPLVEREWHSIKGVPENTGAGTWTGMTWWENQQRWQDMANMLFPTPVADKWLKTLDMTLVFVKPLDGDFDLRTLAQSGGQVLELGVMAFPTSGTGAGAGGDPAAGSAYLDALKKNGARTYRFAIYPNPEGFDGPFTVAYKKNGPPDATGEKWFVYMASYASAEARDRIQSLGEVRHALEGMNASIVKDHSDVQVMTRTTSQVCIKKTTDTCSLDPDDCHVGQMGSGDAWAASCGERPQPCMTEYNACSKLSPKTCAAVGGRHVDACP